MTSIRVLAALLAVGGLAGCTSKDTERDRKLGELSRRVDDLERKVAAGRMGAPVQHLPAGPDPQAVYAVPIDGSPTKGPKDARVTIVEAFEFACPFCERARGTIDALQKEYGDRIRVVPKQFVVHEEVATLPAQAACAANKQGRYSQMEALLWEKGFKNNRNYSPANIDAIAREAGLDLTRFKADLGGDCPRRVQEEQRQLGAFGVHGTPAFFVNGRFLYGAQPLENFKRVIDEELRKADEAVARGVKPEEIYAETVLKTGKKGI